MLDLSRHLPGPFCTQMLADLGAEVIKVEEPGIGDPVRWVPPRRQRESALFLALNRGKRSIALDMKAPGGKEVLRSLARRSDVLVETFRPGVMERLGLGYEALAQENPRLVYCAISGFGQDGPLRDRAGHDLGYQALSGLLALQAAPEVRMPGLQVADLAGGSLPAVIGILAALHERARTGRGQLVDVSMLEGALSLTVYAFSKLLGGQPLAPGSAVELTGALPSYNVYRTSDGRHMALGALEPKFWEAFCRAAGREDMIPGYLEEGPRRTQLMEQTAALFASRTFDQWCALARSVDACLEPVLSLEEALGSPVVRERGYLRSFEDPAEGALPAPGLPFRLSASPARAAAAPPRIGQHTAEILAELGFDEARVRELRKGGATEVRSSLRRLALLVARALGWSVTDRPVATLFRRRRPARCRVPRP